MPNWLPRLYCKYASTKSPKIVHGTSPNTIPESNTSTISCYKFLKYKILVLNKVYIK